MFDILIRFSVDLGFWTTNRLHVQNQDLKEIFKPPFDTLYIPYIWASSQGKPEQKQHGPRLRSRLTYWASWEIMQNQK